MNEPTFKNYETFHASRGVVCEFYEQWFELVEAPLSCYSAAETINALTPELRNALFDRHSSGKVDWRWVARRLVEQTERRMRRRAA